MTEFDETYTDSVTVSDSKINDVSLVKEEGLTLADVLLKTGVKILDDGSITLDDSVTKVDSKSFKDSLTVSSSAVKNASKVLKDELDFSDNSEGSKDFKEYNTARFSNSTGALEDLVDKINSLSTAYTLNSIDVVSGYGGAQYVGVLIYSLT